MTRHDTSNSVIVILYLLLQNFPCVDASCCIIPVPVQRIVLVTCVCVSATWSAIFHCFEFSLIILKYARIIINAHYNSLTFDSKSPEF